MFTVSWYMCYKEKIISLTYLQPFKTETRDNSNAELRAELVKAPRGSKGPPEAPGWGPEPPEAPAWVMAVSGKGMKGHPEA